MTLVDTHTHMFLEQFDEDIKDATQRALSAGVKKMLLPNIDSTTIDRLMKLCAAYPDVYIPMMGLHPCSVKEDFENELAIVEKWFEENPTKFCAVGEIGMDLYWDKTFIEEQKSALKRQLELGKHLKAFTIYMIKALIYLKAARQTLQRRTWNLATCHLLN